MFDEPIFEFVRLQAWADQLRARGMLQLLRRNVYHSGR